MDQAPGLPPYRVQIDNHGRPMAFFPANYIYPPELVAPDVKVVTKEVFDCVAADPAIWVWNGQKFRRCNPSGSADREKMAAFQEHTFAFGRFLHVFAETESFTLNVLAMRTELKPARARALFSGTRTETAQSFIRRLIVADQEPDCPYLERAFPQLSVINDVRNTLVHYGAKQTEKGLIASNFEVAINEDYKREFLVSALDITNMTVDLRTIQWNLALHAYLLNGRIIEDPVVQHVRKFALAPWRYRPPPQAPRQNKRPSISKEQPPPLGASAPSPSLSEKPKKLSSAQKRALRSLGDAP
jgi:hypothetical protein